MWQKKSHKLHPFKLVYKNVKRSVLQRQLSFFTPYFVGISGGSASGKTTFCKQMIRLLGQERVLHISLEESYHRDLAHLSLEERKKTNFDHPDTIEFSLLLSHLDQLFFGKKIFLPEYDFKRFVRNSHSQIISPKPIVLVEGSLLFNDHDIERRLNHKVFIDASEETRFARRLNRDLKEVGKTKESIVDQLHNHVKVMHNLFVEPSRAKADQIVSGEKSFDQEIKELCLKILNEVVL